LLWGPTTPSSAAEVVRRLTTLRHAGEPTQHIPAVLEPDLPRVRRSRVPLLIATGLAAILGGYLLAVALAGGSGSGVPFPDLGRHGSTTSTSAPKTSATGSPKPATTALTPFPLASATSFDPPPGDGSEEQSQAHNAVDGDPATAWFTENYTRADFGGLKLGVGLLLDAGKPVAPTQVEVDFTTPGATFDLRAADSVGSTRDSFGLEGTGNATSPQVKVALSDPTPHRYWLLWLTKLPRQGNGFKAGVAGISLNH
jgi:hypothetical protein